MVSILAGVLTKEGYVSESFLLEGTVEVINEGYCVIIKCSNANDYDRLYAGTENLETSQKKNTRGFKRKYNNTMGFPVIVILLEINSEHENENGDIIQKKTKPSPERIIEVYEHEKRHARNQYFLDGEKTKELTRAKDEIIAYLQNGESLEEIEKHLVGFGGIYEYELKKQELRIHKKGVRRMLQKLKDIQAKYVSLGVLAATPTRL